MNPVVLLSKELAPEKDSVERQLSEALPSYDIYSAQDGDVPEEVLSRVEIAVGHFDPSVLEGAARLRWYQQWSAGADWVLRHPELAGRDFVLTNASGTHPVQITEHILGLMAAFARNLHLNVRAQSEGEWRSERMTGVFELYEKTVLVAGLGAIGTRFARVAQALDMKVIGMRRHPERGSACGVRMIGPAELDATLAEADFVVIALPGTTDTHHMFGARQFARMRRGSYLINIGRGSVVDESALVDALRKGEIAGAGLDVFETEPLPSDSPLWKMEQVIVTPHTSGYTPRYFERVWALFMDNVIRYREGRELRNIVDKQAGY